jgi:putative salt-induced outer membrane protein YdiY
MDGFIKCLIIVLFLTVLPAGSASADEVHLKNGDRISGTFVKMEGNKVIFKTDYAGELKIDWEKIEYLDADKPMNVMLKDGTIIQVEDIYIETGFMKVDKEDRDVEIANIQYINTKPRPPVRITTRVNVGIETERGNTDTDKFNLDGNFVARRDMDRFTVDAELTIEKSNGIDTSRNWKVFGDYSYFLSEKWFLYVRPLFENDEFADLNLRSTYGAGVGYQFFETEELNLLFSAGPGYVIEDFIVAEDDEFSVLQWGAAYDQYFFDRFFQLFHSQNGYISLEDGDNWLINTRQGVRFPLYKGLIASLQFNYDYHNVPSPDATEKWDTKVLFLLGYQYRNW